MAHEASFGLQTADDFFNQIVLAEHEDFLRDNASVRHALLGIITAYHMHEWVWKRKFEKADFIARFPGRADVADNFDLARRITNGTKHFASKISTRTQTGFSPEFSEEFARPLVVEKDDGTEISADALLASLVDFWRNQKSQAAF